MAVAGALDIITSWTPGSAAEAIRAVADSEAVFATHFPYRPVLPGVLLTASMVRLAGLTLAAESDFAYGAVLTGFARAKFRRFVEPGDRVVIRVERRAGGVATEWRAASTVEGARVATIDVVRFDLVEHDAERARVTREDFLSIRRESKTDPRPQHQSSER